MPPEQIVGGFRAIAAAPLWCAAAGPCIIESPLGSRRSHWRLVCLIHGSHAGGHRGEVDACNVQTVAPRVSGGHAAPSVAPLYRRRASAQARVDLPEHSRCHVLPVSPPVGERWLPFLTHLPPPAAAHPRLVSRRDRFPPARNLLPGGVWAVHQEVDSLLGR